MEKVVIGKQVWANKNLDTVTFSNGDEIFHAKSAKDWVDAGRNQTPAWCYYSFNPDNDEVYGKLYNWYAVNDLRGLAPEGWSIPNANDFINLTNLIKIENLNQLKAGNTWFYENELQFIPIEFVDINISKTKGIGTDLFDFNCIPSGQCYEDGTFKHLNHFTYFWSNTVIDLNKSDLEELKDRNTNLISLPSDIDNVKNLVSDIANNEKEKFVFIFCIQCFSEFNEIRLKSVELTTYNAAKMNNGFSIRCIKNNPIISEREAIISSILIDNQEYLDIPTQYKYDKELASILVRKNGKLLQYLPDVFKDDKEIVLMAVKVHGMSLFYASESLKKDRDIVFEAVKKTFRALRFANKVFYDDYEIVFTAVKKSGKALKFSSERIRAIREVVLTAVKSDGDALEYASDNLKNDREIVHTAVLRNGASLRFASRELQDDREIVYTAVNRNGSSLEFASDRLKDDIVIVDLAISNRGYTYKFISERLKQNRELTLKAVINCGYAFEYVPSNFKNDREIVYQAIFYSGFGDMIQFASEELKKDLLLAHIAVKSNKKAHKYLHESTLSQLQDFEKQFGELIPFDDYDLFFL